MQVAVYVGNTFVCVIVITIKGNNVKCMDGHCVYKPTDDVSCTSLAVYIV